MTAERKDFAKGQQMNWKTIRSFMANLGRATKSSPLTRFRAWASIAVVFGVVALTIGFASNLFYIRVLDIQKFWFLPLILILFPSIPEEFFFRGLFIPRDALERSKLGAAIYVFISSLIFALSRPLYELTISDRSQPIFLNLYFLTIIFLLGITCSLGYLLSRSIWVPVFIHWLAALVWVMFLGGGSLILKNI